MRLPGVREVCIDVRGLRLHALDWGGSGPLVFCVHANGYLAAMWHPIAVALADRGHVVGVDLPGHGDSEPAPDYRWDQLDGIRRGCAAGP